MQIKKQKPTRPTQKEEDLDPEDIEDEHNTVETRSKCKIIKKMFAFYSVRVIFIIIY